MLLFDDYDILEEIAKFYAGFTVTVSIYLDSNEGELNYYFIEDDEEVSIGYKVLPSLLDESKILFPS